MKKRRICFKYLFVIGTLVFHVKANLVTAQQLSVKARNGAVVSIDKYASQVGVGIMKKGGNAIDAAVATAFALAVTHPFAGNIGGGGFMLIRLASGEEIGIDYREMAPALATPEMFLKPDGSVDIEKSNFGYLVAGVPGTVKGLETAWQKYGKLPWRTLLQPAIELAENGCYLNKYDAKSLALNKQNLARYPETRKIFFKPDGNTYATEDLLIQKDLAATLKAIARRGSKTFYRGRIANKIVKDFQANGGILTKEDLKNYEVKIRKPIKHNFQGYEVIGMPLPSSGGIAIAEMLNILQQVGLNKETPLDPENLHVLIETMRYVFLDRTRYLGDEDFVEVPVNKLLSEQHAAVIAKKINKEKATLSESLYQNVSVHDENMETTHFSVIDKEGNIVSNTYTLEEAFGSKAVVKGLGFLLNNEMHDFNINPNQANIQGGLGTNPNGIAPKKRMLSSMAPTLVLKAGKPYLITGSPGGRTILNTVLQMVLATTTYKLSLEEAMKLPRLSHHWMPDLVYIEKGLWDNQIIKALEDKGHKFAEVEFLGDLHSIRVNPETGEYEAVADPRRAGWAEGY
ncbi:gamma-glutamyltransferase [Adhaeribacter aquaticus]|uniref:gamma-glutamyltransferase n=1 Tax=Adhaeribacter aquaticus TaxID=299567 RepID=UPI00146FC184|nr:gamma-glutamyltransferase [Adhaeribacter aquaticus]